MRPTKLQPEFKKPPLASASSGTSRSRESDLFDATMSLWQVTTLSVAMVYASLGDERPPRESR